jgi:hypothetical protein
MQTAVSKVSSVNVNGIELGKKFTYANTVDRILESF